MELVKESSHGADDLEESIEEVLVTCQMPL
jgi:hypothetical protein